MKSSDDGPGEPTFGLNVFDLYRDLYEREFRFVSRHEHPVAFFEASTRSSDNAFTEASFGMFPAEDGLQYIEQGYLDAFAPVRLPVGPEAWLRAVTARMETPLSIGRRHIEFGVGGSRDLVIFVLNPANTMDLIDLWNMRQFKRRVLPVHVDWIGYARAMISNRIKTNFRPIRGNPFGTMHHTMIEFARSISIEEATAICSENFTDVPKN
jgi:hypothetical protein